MKPVDEQATELLGPHVNKTLTCVNTFINYMREEFGLPPEDTMVSDAQDSLGGIVESIGETVGEAIGIAQDAAANTISLDLLKPTDVIDLVFYYPSIEDTMGVLEQELVKVSISSLTPDLS